MLNSPSSNLDSFRSLNITHFVPPKRSHNGQPESFNYDLYAVSVHEAHLESLWWTQWGSLYRPSQEQLS